MFLSIPDLIEKIDKKQVITEEDLQLIKGYLYDLELYLYTYLKDKFINLKAPKILSSTELPKDMTSLANEIEKIYPIEELVGTPEDWKKARTAEEVFADLKAMLKEKGIKGDY